MSLSMPTVVEVRGTMPDIILLLLALGLFGLLYVYLPFRLVRWGFRKWRNHKVTRGL
jgi:hypothetical protein